MGYLLSIVVPTKNRYVYLKELVKLIVSFNQPELEFVIQDNSDNNADILKYLKFYANPHIKYFYSSEKLAATENADRAISNSTGEYVCFIGDDDGVVRNIIDVTKSLNKEGIDAAICKTIIYNWPDYTDNSRYQFTGVIIESFVHKKMGFVNPAKSLKRIADDGFGSLVDMPKVYQGIVKKQCLDVIYNLTGTYFPGASPDMANAVALSMVVKRLFYIETPVIITGQSKFVGCGERLLKGNLMNIVDCSFLPKETIDEWDEKLPSLWCSDIIWPFSAEQAMKKLFVPVMINYEKVYARFIYHHPFYKNQICHIERPFLYKFYLWGFRISDIFKFINARITSILSNNRIVGKLRVYRFINNIVEAELFLFNRIKKKADSEWS